MGCIKCFSPLYLRGFVLGLDYDIRKCFCTKGPRKRGNSKRSKKKANKNNLSSVESAPLRLHEMANCRSSHASCIKQLAAQSQAESQALMLQRSFYEQSMFSNSGSKQSGMYGCGSGFLGGEI